MTGCDSPSTCPSLFLPPLSLPLDSPQHATCAAAGARAVRACTSAAEALTCLCLLCCIIAREGASLAAGSSHCKWLNSAYIL